MVNFSDLGEVAAALIIFSLVSAFVKTLLLYSINIVSHQVGNIIARRIIQRISEADYSELIKIRQTDLITSVWQRSNEVVYQTVLPGISFVSAIVIVVINVSLFFFLQPLVTGLIFFGLSLVYFSTYLVVKNKVNIHGKLISILNEKLLAQLAYLFGRYRDLFVKNSFADFIDEYSQTDLNVRISRAKVQIVGGLPKIVIETFFVVLLGFAGLFSVNNVETSNLYLPFLATFIFGMQKLLPQIQQIYQATVALQSGSYALSEIKSLLGLETRKNRHFQSQLPESNAIFEVEDLSFKHSNDVQSKIHNLNFKIFRGEKICISGRSGSGKSTLVDLIIGLFLPSSGEVRSCQLNTNGQRVTILSQHFYVRNGSVRELLTGNSKKIVNDESLYEILDVVELSETIKKLPGGLDYILLNDANNLSGGQRQRLGLAMSLMEDFDILILDEATSQLDRSLEWLVYRNLIKYYVEKTIIFITHTDDLKKLADRIIELD